MARLTTPVADVNTCCCCNCSRSFLILNGFRLCCRSAHKCLSVRARTAMSLRDRSRRCILGDTVSVAFVGFTHLSGATRSDCSSTAMQPTPGRWSNWLGSTSSGFILIPDRFGHAPSWTAQAVGAYRNPRHAHLIPGSTAAYCHHHACYPLIGNNALGCIPSRSASVPARRAAIS